MKRFLSLGAGVQSSTMALMVAKGELPPVDVAIASASKPQTVYDWLDWLEKQAPFPVHRVNGGDLRERIMRRVRREKTGSGGSTVLHYAPAAGCCLGSARAITNSLPIERTGQATRAHWQAWAPTSDC